MRRSAAAFQPHHPRLAASARGLADPRRAVESLLSIEHFNFSASWRLLDALPDGPPDVVLVHNLHGDYFDLRALAPLSRRVPVIATLHDDWLLTGHCAYTIGCERWRASAPYLTRSRSRSRSRSRLARPAVSNSARRRHIRVAGKRSHP